MWAQLDDATLLRSSDLIVMGEWRGSTTPTDGSVGYLAVTEVLKGVPGTRMVQIALPSTQFKSGNDLVYRPGDKGLWLLRRHPENKDQYLADHPQRFVPSAGGDERIKQLRRLLPPL